MQESNTSVVAPSSVQDVELLIQRLYDPARVESVSQIDDQLKRLQLSTDGWQLADTLLGSSDANVRFFGALTFQVKLNNDGARLDPVAAQSILTRILSWTIRLDAAGEGPLVRKKLCAALAAYTLRSPVQWDQPILHLAVLFQRGAEPLEVPEQITASRGDLQMILQSLTESQLVVLLWLCSSLATDASKIDSSNSATAKTHAQMEIIVESASAVLHHALQRKNLPNAEKVQSEVLVCFSNWVNYAQPMWPTKQEALQHLRDLIEQLAPLLIDANLQAEATDVFRDILEGYTSFFQPPHMRLFAQVIYQHLRPRLLNGLQSEDPDALQVALFIIAYGTASIERVVKHPEDELGSQCIVEVHLAMLQVSGYPGDDDHVSIQSIEFWNAYSEYFIEETYSGGDTPAWAEKAKETCMRLTTLIWSKMRTPPASIAQGWTELESEVFREFRMDASDLLLSIYLPLGKELLQRFVDIIKESLQSKNWQNIEAAVFCINVLADNVLEDPRAGELLSEVFGSTLFRDVADFSQSIPSQARRTAIDMLGAYGQYIEHHAEFLPDTLRFLFASLENTGLYLSAAKSIAALCSTCRSSLTGELSGFLEQYNRFAASRASEPYTNEKVIGAIAAIVQACTPDSAKVPPLLALLDIVDKMIANSAQVAVSGDLEHAHTLGVSALECLASIGKNLQEPDDVLVDLYDDQTKSPAPNFWHGDEGRLLHDRILKSCQTVLQLFPKSGEAVDAVCNVLRSGFVETQPGPFVFSPDTIITFLEQCTPTTPHVESVLAMVGQFIMQYTRATSPRIDADIARIYTHIGAFIRALRDPRQDPSIAHSCLDILTRMLHRYAAVVLDMSAPLGATVESILHFALQALAGADLMPKRSAADLWTRLLRLVPPSPAPTTSTTDPSPLHTRQQQILTAYGPLLTNALTRQISGAAQRSELDSLCEPLRALIQTQPSIRTWLEAALEQIPQPSATTRHHGSGSGSGIDGTPPDPAHSRPVVSPADKRRFVQALLRLRGDAHKTRDVVRNFYAACRGTVPSYV